MQKGNIFQSFALFIVIFCSMISKTLPNIVQTTDKQGIPLKNITAQLYNEFNTIANEELGIDFIQKLYSKFKYISVIQDVNKTLSKIAHKFQNKLNESITILNASRSKLESFFKNKNRQPMKSVIIPNNSGEYSSDEGEVHSRKRENLEEKLDIKEIIQKEMKKAKAIKGAVKYHYFINSSEVNSKRDLEISHLHKFDQSLIWNDYLSRIDGKKNIMLLVDHGGSLSKRQFRIVKSLAKQMISVLSNDDTVGVLAISDTWTPPYLTEHCIMPNQTPPKASLYNISPATPHFKNLLNMFIDSLDQGNGATNHSLGFQQALEIIKSTSIPSNQTIMLLYISRGLLSSITEQKIVIETINSALLNIDVEVIINTCAVIDDNKPVMYETHFLHNLVEQNYTQNKHGRRNRGIMLQVNLNESIGAAVARFYGTLNLEYAYNPKIHISNPLWDSKANDLSILLTTTINNVGVIGLNLHFSSIAEDITYYSNYMHYTYAFLVDSEGIAIMHPSYPRPMAAMGQVNFVDISHLEKVSGFEDVKKEILATNFGTKDIISNDEKINYIWKNIMNLYTICIVIKEKEYQERPYKVNWYPSLSNNKLVDHRLDMLDTSELCNHLNQLATLDAGSLYLSASCFQSPFSYIHSTNTSPIVTQTYMAYLKDNTRMISNPGLREDIRDDVAALAHIMDYLRNQHLSGSKTKYIVRRYVASNSGVLQVFPGVVIAPGMEPTRRTWFLRAVENKEHIILTPPYLDAGGAGYIVTISYATENLVVAMDVTFGYVYKLLLERMPFCIEKTVKCFLMDDRGYLIYHPKLIDPNGPGPIEQQHIIHKESVVANDILNHNNLVKKILCNNYADGTIQRYYRLNMSLDEILVNSVPGEHCVRYQLSIVEGTNAFVGVVNATCKVGSTFCPCSMVNRLCLNCNRMEQKECECPCECPLNLETCIHPNKSLIENPLCSLMPEPNYLIYNSNEYFSAANANLKPCLPISCESELSYESCLGILGCEWCNRDVDGETFLANPFCASILSCFNGVLGSPTPYGDAVSSISNNDDLGSSYSPVGPVIGSVIGVGVLLVLLFFCYRSYTSPTVDRFYLTTQENQIGMSDLNISDDYHEIDNHQDKLLQDSKKSKPVVSPYCVSTGYRRPQTAVDSDHGYSTMTPHDESEHLSLAPIEIDSLEDDGISDATSINTSVSSKQPSKFDPRSKLKIMQQPDLKFTSLPNRNCIIAPVTVHRNMEQAQ